MLGLLCYLQLRKMEVINDFDFKLTNRIASYRFLLYEFYCASESLYCDISDACNISLLFTISLKST